MRLTLIVAMSDNRVIGRDGQLPWHLSDDLKRFKRITMGHPILMGRKTHASIGRPLPGRENIVLTRQNISPPEHVTFTHDLQQILQQLASHHQETFVIGGGELYAQTLPLADRLLITRIHQTLEGDTFFPDFDVDDFITTHHEVFEGPVEHDFSVLIRKTV